MHVKVAGFSQDMDFSDGSVTNFVVLELPTGQTVRAILSDEGARTLIEARASSGPMPGMQPMPAQYPAPPAEAPPQHAFAPPSLGDSAPEEDDEGAFVFGGDGNTDAPIFMADPNHVAAPPEMPPQQAAPHPFAHNDPATQQRLYQQHQADQKKRQKRGPSMGRTVPKDAMGYPITRNGGADPQEVMGQGTGAVDEDGIGQA